MNVKEKRKTIIDKTELDREVLSEFKRYNPWAKNLNSLAEISKEIANPTGMITTKLDSENELRNVRSRVYARMRNEKKLEQAIFWTQKMDSGNFRPMLNKMGLALNRNGKVYCSDNGRAILTYWLENYVLKEIEKQLNLTGIKVRNGITCNSHNLLDFTNCTPIQKEKSHESEDNPVFS